jgi:hypothetical protein
MPRVTTKKVPAHDRWVCLDCRWSAKIALIDARASNRPTYKCPKCAKRMLWTGTAFRPPRRADNEGWLIAERILLAGHRFRATRDRERFPRTLVEVDAWLESHARGHRWLEENPISVEKTSVGELKVRSGRRLLIDGEPLLVLNGGAWDEGRLRLRGDGRRPLSGPMVNLPSARRSLPLTSGTRVRLKSMRG